MKVLVTGAAGFIGYHVCRRLMESNACELLGVDNLSDYYSVELKRDRLAELGSADGFRFLQLDLADTKALAGLMGQFKPDYVVHLAAQPGVRYSMTHPEVVVQCNLVGFAHVLEACRQHPPKHLVYASSSSVYGDELQTPFAEDAVTDSPISFYAASKKANEAMAHSYAHAHDLLLTGLRFFTAYGPWGRPDMAVHKFTRAIVEGTRVPLFNEGKNRRDYTYVDDIASGVLQVLLYPPEKRPTPPHRIFNLGHHRPVETRRIVDMLAQLLGRPAKLELLPPQPGDVFETCADLTRVRAAVGFEPKTPLEEGLGRFVDWFRSYYRISD